MDANSEATLRHMIRTRLAAGSLFPVDGKLFAGKGTGKPCTICGMRIHIDRENGNGISPQAAEYSVSFGGSKDRVGTILLGRPQGLGAVIVFLRSLGVAEAEINTASQILTDQSYYTIRDVVLTPAVLRRFR
jgi:hypothetical protein